MGTDPVECCLVEPGVMDLRGPVVGFESRVFGVMLWRRGRSALVGLGGIGATSLA
jgi:hypothetical protein